MMNFATTYRKA